MGRLQNLLVDSSYETPWIIWANESQHTISRGDWGVYEIPHGLPFTPLIFGEWSLDANFSTSYDASDMTPNYAGAGQPELAFICSADATNLYLDITNNRTTSTTFYVRMMGFAPPEYAGEITPVEYPGNFRFNSQRRYQKLYMAGRVAGGGTSGSTITHNLGYLPQARVWTVATTGRVLPAALSTVTTTTLNTGAYDTAAYYHIYGDRMDG